MSRSSPGWPFHQPDSPGSGTKLMETVSRSRRGFRPAPPVGAWTGRAIPASRNHTQGILPKDPQSLAAEHSRHPETAGRLHARNHRNPVKPGACQIPAQNLISFRETLNLRAFVGICICDLPLGQQNWMCSLLHRNACSQCLR